MRRPTCSTASTPDIRCAPGPTNPLYPSDAEEDPGCAPTLDELRYETVKINVAQLGRQGPKGIWVVTGWETIESFEQVAPASDAEVEATLGAFLQAKFGMHKGPTGAASGSPIAARAPAQHHHQHQSSSRRPGDV